MIGPPASPGAAERGGPPAVREIDHVPARASISDTIDTTTVSLSATARSAGHAGRYLTLPVRGEGGRN